MIVRRDGRELTLHVQPVRDSNDGGLMQIGIEPAAALMIPDTPDVQEFLQSDLVPTEWKQLRPGDRVTAVNGVALPMVEDEKPPVSQSDQATLAKQDARDKAWAVFQREVTASFGAPVALTMRGKDGSDRQVALSPRFTAPFGDAVIAFAGMQPRTQVNSITDDSAARGKLRAGDAIVRVSVDATGDAVDHPTHRMFLATIANAAERESTITITVQRDQERLTFDRIPLAIKIPQMDGPSRRGVGLGMESETGRAVVGAVGDGSSAAKAGVVVGDRIVSIDGQPVASWFDVHRVFANSQPGQTRELAVIDDAGQSVTRRVTLGAQDIQAVRAFQYVLDLPLREHLEKRRTTNPFVAVGWGVRETRDLIVQFYVVLRRMSQGTISPSNMSGPAGIFHHGIRLASRGTDWMVWYLAMISANLAVVNFLPLPIVDGGHFVFLLIEKIRGRPAPPRVMLATQLIGLALIVGLFLFVTYNDIMRMM
jgi:regulator of sigma E protease